MSLLSGRNLLICSLYHFACFLDPLNMCVAFLYPHFLHVAEVPLYLVFKCDNTLTKEIK